MSSSILFNKIKIALPLLAFTINVSAKDIQNDKPWYFGTFSYTTTVRDIDLGDGVQTLESIISCRSKLSCESILQEILPVHKILAQTPTVKPKSLDVAPFNAALEHTRRTVRKTPAYYDNPFEGAKLQALRPVLESAAVFDKCIDVTGIDSDLRDNWGKKQAEALCHLQGDVASDLTIVHALPTPMATPTPSEMCESRPLCNFDFWPMKRIIKTSTTPKQTPPQ